MSKHTPGPWSVQYETDIAAREDGVGPVDVAHVYMRTAPGRTEANARLLAAAPELLEALKSMCEGFKPLKDADFPALAKARAAIAKAEGKP